MSIRLEAVWSAKRKRWESPDGEYYFDTAAAERAVSFFPEFLRLTDGPNAGQPMELLEAHDLLIVRPLFGWKRVSDGYRRFNKVLFAVPKGNGKTPLGAGLGIYAVFADGDRGSEGYILASDKDQGRLMYNDAAGMVEANPDDLKLHAEGPRIEVLTNTMYSHARSSNLQLVSSKASGKHGVRPQYVGMDEFHAFESRELVAAFRESLAKREQPIMLMLTHAGQDDESICVEEWDMARRLIAGEIRDDSYLPVLFEARSDEDHFDPKVWARVNPGLGRTKSLRGMQDLAQGVRNSPRKLADFLMYQLNRRMNDAIAWIPSTDWDACKGPVAEDAQLAKLVVAGGVDGAEKNDLFAFVLAFKHPLDGRELTVDVPDVPADGPLPESEQRKSLNLNYSITLVPFFWIPEDTLKRHEETDRVPYSEWRKDGLIRVTPGSVIDHDRIFREICELRDRFPLLKQAEIGYDPAKVTQFALSMRGVGFNMVEVKQNYSLSEPSLMFEALVGAQRVHHGGHRVLRWNLLNTHVRRDPAGRIRPVKPKKQTRRIDGTVASIMALARLHFMQPPKRQSYKVIVLE